MDTAVPMRPQGLNVRCPTCKISRFPPAMPTEALPVEEINRKLKLPAIGSV